MMQSRLLSACLSVWLVLLFALTAIIFCSIPAFAVSENGSEETLVQPVSEVAANVTDVSNAPDLAYATDSAYATDASNAPLDSSSSLIHGSSLTETNVALVSGFSLSFTVVLMIGSAASSVLTIIVSRRLKGYVDRGCTTYASILQQRVQT